MTFAIAILAATVLAAEPAPTLSDAQLRVQVDALLRSIDTPIPEARWRALGVPASDVLAEVVASDDQMPSRRVRALAALATVDAPRAEALSRALLDAVDVPAPLRQSAVQTLGRILPPEQVRAALAPVLRAGDSTTLRAVAAETMARHAPGWSCAEVMDQVALEREGNRPAFERAAVECSAKP